MDWLQTILNQRVMLECSTPTLIQHELETAVYKRGGKEIRQAKTISDK